jgi:hypothetical protein
VKYLVLLVLLVMLAGCAPMHTKKHGLVCVGLCVHTERDMTVEEKKRGGKPKPAAPDSSTEPTS